MKQAYILVLFFITLLACNNKQASSDKTLPPTTNYEVQYAKGFQVTKTADYTHITVRNPWDTTKLLNSYVLVDKKKELPTQLPQGLIIRTPISKAAATSVIHCSTLNELNSINIIKGQCEPHYINIDYIKEGVRSGAIIDLGMARNPDTEKLIMLDPEVVFSDPVTGQNQVNIEKSMIPIIQTPDYTEPHPLGRAEWIRYYSLFVDQENLADSIFNITVENYKAVQNIITNLDYKPAVFIDTRYQGSWNMPGGNSYMAKLLADAGANYLWADTESSTFISLSFEAVLDKAGKADIWLIRHFSENNMTYPSLEKEYKSYTYFKAFEEKKVYACNTKHSKYYEDLPIHPDYILKDLAATLHPQLFEGYETMYYKKIED